MGKETEIGWCDSTFNPWWGCVRVSPGCEHCYAQSFTTRLGMDLWGPTAPRRFFGDKHWDEPLRWDAHARTSGKPWRVFCASMADICEDREDLVPYRERLMSLVAHTRHLTWLFLTKRPEDYLRLFGEGFFLANPHVWPGFTAENQAMLDKRASAVLELPGSGKKWMSVEPLLGPVSFRWAHWDDWKDGNGARRQRVNHLDGLKKLDWVIVGGESGPGARPCDVAWIRSIVEQCKTAAVPVFVKQLGAKWFNRDIRQGIRGSVCVPVDESIPWIRIDQKDKKGGDPSEWPADLRVREWPR